MTNMERQGFGGVVGKVDGTDIVLKYKPGGVFDGEMFWNRKKRYALDVCAVCNSKKEIIYFLTGWPNSQHDACVFASTHIHRNPTEFFGPGQYLLGDAAYTHTKYMVPPYKAPEANRSENRKFNKKLSKVQIDIEHTFEMLKGRWASLTALRLVINTQKQYRYALKWITAYIVLHNILLQLNDEWEKDEGWWTEEEEERHDADINLLDRAMLQEGIGKREAVKRMVLHM